MTITVTRRTILPVALVTAAVLAAYLLGSARPSVAVAASQPFANGSSSAPTTGITVIGKGTVTGTPDTLTVSLSATATARTIQAALAQANSTQAAIVGALKSRGVAAADIQTSQISVQPGYTSKGLPSGYAVNEGITARIHGLAKAGDTLSAAVAAGGDAVRVDSVYVAIDDTDPLMAEARSAAITDARQRAEQYAGAAGVKVGALQTISEVVSTPVAYNYAVPQAYEARAASGAVPIQAGSQDVTVNVSVTYAVA